MVLRVSILGALGLGALEVYDFVRGSAVMLVEFSGSWVSRRLLFLMRGFRYPNIVHGVLIVIYIM